MEIISKKISEIIPNPRNIRRHNKAQVQELAKSIQSFGVIRPIVIDENGVILCGHGLFDALVELGKDTVDCKVVSGLTEKQKKKLMLADNKIYELASNDYDMIDGILREFGQEGDFSIPGYQAETLEDLYGIKSIEKEVEAMPSPVPAMPPVFDSPEKNDGDKEDSSETPTPSKRILEERQKALQRNVIVCPHCGGIIEL